MMNMEQYRITYKAFREALHNEYTTCLVIGSRRPWLEGEALAEHLKHFEKWQEKVIRICQEQKTDIIRTERFFTVATSKGIKRLDNSQEYVFYNHRPRTKYYCIAKDTYMVDAGGFVMFYRIDESF